MSQTRLNQLFAFHQASPKDSFILFALAKEHENLDDDDQALRLYRQLLEHDPHYVGTYYHLGKLYEKLGELSQAFNTYRKGMEIARQENDQHSYNELAGAKLNLGDDEDF